MKHEITAVGYPKISLASPAAKPGNGPARG